MSWNPRIPARYQDAKLEDVPENIVAKFNEIHKTRKGMYIYGSVGTGKTHIAYSLFKQPLSAAGDGAKFWNTTELLREIRADFDRPNAERSHVEDELMHHRGVLFLDDMGAEKITDWVLERFYLLINRMYNERMPIVFTSNCTIQELAERVGDRIASRIVEMCDIINLTGADRRLVK